MTLRGQPKQGSPPQERGYVLFGGVFGEGWQGSQNGLLRFVFCPYQSVSKHSRNPGSTAALAQVPRPGTDRRRRSRTGGKSLKFFTIQEDRQSEK